MTGGLLLLGGAGGIGAEAARACLRSDTERPVWITYNSDAAAAESLREELGRGTVVQCDAGDPAACEALAKQIRDSGAGISTVIHSVVGAVSAPLVGSGPELLRGINVSAVSLVHAVSALGDLLLDGASVTYLTSIGASRVMPGYGMVGVAKAAAEAIVRYLAFELGARGITVNAVGCGPVETKALSKVVGDTDKLVARAAKLTAIQPTVGVEEVGDAIAFLSSPAGRGFTGQVLHVDGGLTLRA